MNPVRDKDSESPGRPTVGVSNGVNRMRLWIAAAIIALIVVIGFAFSVPHTRDATVPTPAEGPATVPEVSVRDSFKKGTHTITGSLEMSDACGIVSAEATVATSSEGVQSIVVAVSLLGSEGVCLELPTRATFSTTVVAPAALPITVTVNGAAVTTTAS